MGCDGNILFLLKNLFDVFIIDIFHTGIIFGHDRLNSLVIPDRLISMEFIILWKHLYFFRVLSSSILPFEIFLIIIDVVILLELDVVGGKFLIYDLFDVFGVVEVLSGGVFARKWLGNEASEAIDTILANRAETILAKVRRWLISWG